MKFLSDNTVKLLFVFLIIILVFGPTSFIQKIFVSSVGKMIQNFPSMAFFSDPIVGSGFSEAWTIFFIAFPLSYTGLMGVFVAKISKGRTIRTLVFACMLGISIGTWVFFAVDGGLAMHRELNGAFSMVEAVEHGNPYRAVFDLMNTLPPGLILAIIYVVCVSGFICTTLDAASLALASTTSRLDEDNNPKAVTRLFWCVMLTLVPLAMLFSGADFNAMKNLAILVSVPLAVVLLLMTLGLLRWLSEDRKKENMLTLEADPMERMAAISRIEDDTKDQ